MSLLGYYLLISLVFVFGTMAELACVLFIKQKQELTNVAENTGFSEQKSHISKSHDATDALRKLSMVEPIKENKIYEPKDNDEETRKMNFWSKKGSIIYGLPLTTKIDLAGFIVFHLTFLLFNVIYWLRILHVSGTYD